MLALSIYFSLAFYMNMASPQAQTVIETTRYFVLIPLPHLLEINTQTSTKRSRHVQFMSAKLL